MTAEVDRFIAVRDLAVMIGRTSLALSIRELETWIAQAERTLATGPMIVSTMFRDGGEELEKQITYMKALLEFRRAIGDLDKKSD